MPDARSRLRKLLNGPEMVVAPFVYDCLHARLAQREGFKAIYMTGFGTAAARGFPDLGLLTMDEMIENVRALARSVDIPVICDADTGYGEAINVQRTIREYEDAGAAALAYRRSGVAETLRLSRRQAGYPAREHDGEVARGDSTPGAIPIW